LTIVNYHFKPSTKHGKRHISISNIGLGFILTEFYSFGEFLFLQGVNRKIGKDMKDIEKNIKL
jgi:hypothetical protein